MNAIQRFFFNIFLFCFGLGLFLFIKLDSYGAVENSKRASIYYENGSSTSPNNFWYSYQNYFNYLPSNRTCAFLNGQSVYIYSLDNSISEYNQVVTNKVTYEQTFSGYRAFSWNRLNSDGFVYYYSFLDGFAVHDLNVSNIPLLSTLDEVIAYLRDGVLPQIPFDSTLQLDSFKVSSWSIGNFQALFKSKFDVTWSDPRINVVQVRISGTASEASYESSSSPFKGKFQADQFVFEKGDVIHLVATPYKADGSYGTSLYYSVVYSDNAPFSNTYRKLVNNNNNDNTLTIPYSGTSGNDTVTLPVDGVTTNVTYKVNYNPVTNEYGDINLYEIYYSPVVVYPVNTSDQEVDDTQDEIINNYNTTNYYETTKNINLSFDIDFGDISTNDIGEGFNGVSGFFNGFGDFIGRLSNWILALFPFLPPIVANTIVFMFGLVIFIAGIALILKIIGAVGNIIDAILPL